MDFGALSSRLSRRLAGLLLAGTVLAAPALAQEQAPEDPAVFADPLVVPAADGGDESAPDASAATTAEPTLSGSQQDALAAVADDGAAGRTASTPAPESIRTPAMASSA